MCVTCQNVGVLGSLDCAPLAESREQEVMELGNLGRVRTTVWDGCTALPRGSGFWRVVLVHFQRLINQNVEERK